MQSALVSILMAAYNAEQYIGAAIESVLAQSYPHWELIIVNDGSTDATAEIAASYADSRIRLLHQANGGEAAARNTAMEHAGGEFLAILDADDLYQPNHLEVTVNHLQNHPNHAAVYTDGYHINQAGALLKPLSARRRGPFQGRIYEEVARACDVFGPPGCVVLRSQLVLENELRFDPQIIYGTDWDFLTRCADLGQFGYVNQFTYLYRIHQKNMTLYTGNQKRIVAWTRCRSKAIKMANFKTCSPEARTAVFYDLLINLLIGLPEQQNDVIQWPEFAGLPTAEQARLLRLMASKAVINGGSHLYINEWLRLARELNPEDKKGALLAALYNASPMACRWLLRAKQPKPAYTSPFGDIE